MVVFVDLEDDLSDDPYADPDKPRKFSTLHRHHPGNKVTTKVRLDGDDGSIETRPNPNINSFSAALGAYPIVSQLAHNVDLNTLDALSRTCRQIRANVLQYRNRLVQQTLRCENECHDTKSVDGEKPGQKWHILGEAGHLVSGKVSTCARDLVSDCRRCGRIVCRNCTCKPPSSSSLPSRHRRLCPACLSAPLPILLSLNSSPSPCTCTSSIHLCAPCGASLSTADTTYRRVWTWRTRYATSYGGLGTGIGEGNEGVKCARGKECEGAVDVEVEFECSSSNGGGGVGSRNGSNSNLSSGSDGGSGRGEREGSESPWGEKEEAGYLWQEVEGLGGVVKKKVRKRERVGGTVREWEDEREGRDEILGREKRGAERSWCGWCGRVVLGGRDLEDEGGERGGEGETVRK